MKFERIAIIGGVVLVVGVGAYFVIKAISQPTQQVSDACSGDWTDYINPSCIIGGVRAGVSNAANTATNEVNIILIILAAVVIAVVGLLAFGPQTGHIARGATALAL